MFSPKKMVCHVPYLIYVAELPTAGSKGFQWVIQIWTDGRQLKFIKFGPSITTDDVDHPRFQISEQPRREYRFPEAEFKEFEPRLKFETRLKYGWFHLKLYSMFQELSRRYIETGYWRNWDAA